MGRKPDSAMKICGKALSYFFPGKSVLCGAHRQTKKPKTKTEKNPMQTGK